MSMIAIPRAARSAVFAALLACLLVCGCGNDAAPKSPIDVDTPVRELPGWEMLLTAVDLTDEVDHGLANWVDVFRNGLDILYLGEKGDKLQTDLQNWWAEAPKAMASIVGPEHVETAMAWLEQQYGPRPQTIRGTP